MSPGVLEDLRAAGEVLRYHTCPLRVPQNIAQHSYNVALLVLALRPDASAALLKAALTHDAPELITGDVPSPAKWQFPELEEALRRAEAAMLERIDFPALEAAERKVLKLADHLEGAYFCIEQAERGDARGAEIGAKFLNAIAERGGLENPVAAVYWQRLSERLANITSRHYVAPLEAR